MMQEDQQVYRRATGAVGLGLGLQAAASLLLTVLWLWSGEPALRAVWGYALAGFPLWIILWLIYQQHRLEQTESLEAEQLRQRHGGEASMFEGGALDLRVHRRRLEGLYRWGLAVTSLLTSFLLITLGLWPFLWGAEADPTRSGLLIDRSLTFLAAAVGMAFVLFLVSRYLAGMARQKSWQLLRGGAGYLMGLVLMGTALVAAFGAIAGAGWMKLLEVMRLAIPVFTLVVGIEMALNFILAIYRPRRAGEVPRPAFDSRLLNLLTSPESIARTVSEAINYQFGFEITRSWFWQLLSRAFGWLILLGAGILLLMSTLVLVQPHQEALITTFGRLRPDPAGPGLHFKMPWPVGRVQYFDVTRVRQIQIGSEGDLKDEDEQTGMQMPILWSQQHSLKDPEPLIVAPPALFTTLQNEASGASSRNRAPAVSLVNAEIFLDYRIARDRLIEYVRANPASVAETDYRLQAIGKQVVSAHLLTEDIDAWIGSARQNAGSVLKTKIQQAVDRAGLGIEVVAVSVAGIHPPADVAGEFHQVVSAEQQRQERIERARREAIKLLTEVAGSQDLARLIAGRIDALDAARARGETPEKLNEQEEAIEDLLRSAGGQAAVAIAEARAYRWQKTNTERGRADRFLKQRLAYQGAPGLYKARRYLEALAEGLETPRKIVLAGERSELFLRTDLKNQPGEQLDFLKDIIEAKEKAGP